MSSSDDEKYENKSKKQSFQSQSKIVYNELPKLKTKILNKNHTREILRYYIKEKKTIINYLKEKLEKEEKKLRVLECDLEEFDLSTKLMRNKC